MVVSIEGVNLNTQLIIDFFGKFIMNSLKSVGFGVLMGRLE